VVATYVWTADDQTEVTYETVAVVSQTGTDVGNVTVTVTTSVVHAETDETKTETVSATVTVTTGVGTMYDDGTPKATVSTYTTYVLTYVWWVDDQTV
jgi:hypothetical protein